MFSSTWFLQQYISTTGDRNDFVCVYPCHSSYRQCTYSCVLSPTVPSHCALSCKKSRHPVSLGVLLITQCYPLQMSVSVPVTHMAWHYCCALSRLKAITSTSNVIQFVTFGFFNRITRHVCLKYGFASCPVLLICWFFLILCSHRFFFFLYERAMCSLENSI